MPPRRAVSLVMAALWGWLGSLQLLASGGEKDDLVGMLDITDVCRALIDPDLSPQ